MTPVNLLLIAFGPPVVIGGAWLLARLGDRLAERDAETMRQLGLMHVQRAEEEAE